MAEFEPLFSGVEEAVAIVVVAAAGDNESVNEFDILFPGTAENNYQHEQQKSWWGHYKATNKITEINITRTSFDGCSNVWGHQGRL